MGFPGDSILKNLHSNAGGIRNMGLIPGSRRFPGRGNANPLQCSCLENPMDREAWWPTVYGVTRVRHHLVHVYTHTHIHTHTHTHTQIYHKG